MKKSDKLGTLLLSNPFPFFIGLFSLSFLTLKLKFLGFINLNNLLTIVFSILITEFILRFILFCIYGKKYIYRFIPFKMVNNKKCGYRFYRNLDSEKLDFPIYDRDSFPHNFEVPVDKYKNKKNRIKFSTDQNSLRITPYKVRDKKNCLKIICSGGSTTAGCCIDDSDTWPNQLKLNLNKNNINCEVLNAGVYGYDSYQELQNFKNYILKLKPNILILHQGWNEEFAFSMLGAGKYFRPNHARRYFEAFYFYSNNIPFFPYKSLLALLSFRHIRRYICLERDMSFQRKKRWNVLLHDGYIKNWFDNLYEIYKLCQRNNVKLYLADYPCLVNNMDTPKERKIYVDNSRLTNNFASYQAFSKARIENFYNDISGYFEILDGNSMFKNIKGIDRLEYFNDEIHLSKKGESLLAQSICKSITKELSKDQSNQIKSKNKNKRPLEFRNYLNLKDKIGKNPSDLNIDIRKYIYNLKEEKLNNISISTDLYTTS